MKVINDLYDYEPLKIVQDSASFKFSLDSILLAEFVQVHSQDKILDLCTGNAAIPFILSFYVKNKITAFEIQESIFHLAKEGVSINHLENQIDLIHGDIREIRDYFPGNNYDVVLANPPYFRHFETSIVNKNKAKSIARHEITLHLEDLFDVGKYILKDNGYFYLVHLPERLEEILYLCEKYNLVAKRIQFVYTKVGENATMVLLECVKGAKNSLKVCPPLYTTEYKSYKNIFRR